MSEPSVAAAAAAAAPPAGQALPPAATEIDHVRKALVSVGEAAYHWNTNTDKLTWSADAAAVLGVDSAESIQTGRGYASLLDPDNFTSRFEAVMRTPLRDEGAGVSYHIEYLFRPRGRGEEASSLARRRGPLARRARRQAAPCLRRRAPDPGPAAQPIPTSAFSATAIRSPA